MRARLAPVLHVAAAAMAAAWAAAYVRQPLGADHGIWLWIGEVITDGGVPYRDAVDIKGPVPFYIAALSHALFGRGQTGLRILDLLFVAAALRLLWGIRGGRDGARPALIACVAFTLWYGSHESWRTAQADGWAGILLLAGLGPLISRADSPKAWHWSLCGVLIGLATLTKPPYGLFLSIPVFDAAARSRTGKPEMCVRWIGLMLAGFIGMLGLVVLWFAITGAFGAFVESNIRYPLGIYAATDRASSPAFIAIADYARQSPFRASVPLFALGAWADWRRRRRFALAQLLWVIVCVGTVAAQGKYWPYHWLVILPPLALLAAGGADVCVHQIRPLLRRDAESRKLSKASLRDVTALSLLTVALLDAAEQPARMIYHHGRLLTGLSQPLSPDEHRGALGRDEPSLAAVATYLRATTDSLDYVLGWGNLALLNYLAGRRSPTRFADSRMLVDGGDNPFRRRYRLEFQDELALHPPAVVVTRDRLTCARVAPESYLGLFCLYDYGWFREYLEKHYAPAHGAGAYVVLRRTEPPGAATDRRGGTR